MKKEYKKPELYAIGLDETSVIATSLYDTGNGTTEAINGGVYNGEFDSKQRENGFYSGWNDEYEIK